MFYHLAIAEHPCGKTWVIPLLPLIGYLMWAAEALFAPPNPIWAAALFLWALCAARLSWWLTSKGDRNGILDFVDRHSSGIATGLIALFAAFFIVVSYLQAAYFAMGAHAEDTAYYSQILWNTLQGDLLLGNVQQERLYSPPVTNDLALHVSPVIFAILPIYAIFQSFLTLLIIRDIALAAAAWPLFALVRERMGGTAAVCAVLLYLTNPAIVAQSCEAFYLLQLAPLPFFGALRAFANDDFRNFTIWTILGLAVREDVAIAMAGFGVWALVTKTQWRWAVLGLALPILWWGVATLLIQPTFGRWGNSAFDVALAGGKSTPLGLYQTIFASPNWILTALSDGGLEYLYRSIRSVAFLGILGWEALLSIPGFAANLFLGQVFYSGTDPISRFALLPSCALIGATVFVVWRIANKYRWDTRLAAILMFLLLPSVSILDGLKDTIQIRLELYTVQNNASVLEEAIGQIPQAASVAAPNYALPALSKRSKLFYITYLDSYPQAKPDFVLLDRDLERITTNEKLRVRYVSLLEAISRSPDYKTIWQNGSYVVLRRGGYKS
jgi:Predicted membrane protein (DUF2079)